jgi:putative transposase
MNAIRACRRSTRLAWTAPKKPGRINTRHSTSRTGSCFDSAGAESFFATIKTQIGVDAWPGRAAARRDIERWITDYSQRRLHCSLGYQTPVEARTA